jgi:hypothetical protein
MAGVVCLFLGTVMKGKEISRQDFTAERQDSIEHTRQMKPNTICIANIHDRAATLSQEISAEYATRLPFHVKPSRRWKRLKLR